MKILVPFVIVICFAWINTTFSQVTTFTYSGAMATYTVPAGVTSIQIETWGAQGGSSVGLNGASAAGGLGGYAIGELDVLPGQVLRVYVGGQGGTTGPGGFNGGGQAATNYGAAGGGGSDVRISPYNLTNRVIVGGGGGGGSFGTYGTIGGDGGGLIGDDGNGGFGFSSGKGGTQVAGGNGGCCYPGTASGSFGQGGGTGAYHNAGGGGGRYGGGSGAGYAAAGGGSSYINGVLFGSTTPGVRAGNGLVVITVNCDPLTVTVSSDELCLGDELILEATSDNGGALTWDSGAPNGVAFTPASSGLFTYRVDSDNGDDCWASVDIEVFPIPIVNAGVDDSDICMGDSVIFSESGDADSYVWDPVEVSPGDPFFPDLGITTYTLTGTYSATGCSNSSTVEVEVYSLPLIEAGAAVFICSGDSVLLAGEGAGDGGVYIWDGGILDSVYFDPLLSGIYTVIGTDANGCQATDEVEVTVYELPIIDAGLNDSICFGSEVALTATGLLDPDGFDWVEDIDNGVPFTPLASATYHVVGTDENGCINTDSVEVFVYDLPIIDAGEDQAVCFGTEIVLNGDGAGLDGSYAWSGGVEDGIAFTPTLSALYYLTGTDANGCDNNDSVEVVVFSLPLIDAGVDQVICAGDTVVLMGAGAGPEGSYDWSDDIVDGEVFVPDLTSEFVLTGTDSSACVNTDTVLIIVNALPIISAGEDVLVCEEESILLAASGAGVDGNYNWDNGVVNGIDFIPIVSGTYHVIGQDSNGCVNNDSLVLTILPLPTVNAGEDQLVCLDSLITLSVVDPDIAYSYSWNNGVVSGESFQANYEGTEGYTLTAVSSDGCIRSDEVLITIINCDTLLILPTGFSPNNDGVNDYLVFTGIPLDQTMALVVFNEWGMTLFESNDYQNDWDGTNQVGTAFVKGKELPVGTYYYVLRYGNEVVKNYLYIER